MRNFVAVQVVHGGKLIRDRGVDGIRGRAEIESKRFAQAYISDELFHVHGAGSGEYHGNIVVVAVIRGKIAGNVIVRQRFVGYKIVTYHVAVVIASDMQQFVIVVRGVFYGELTFDNLIDRRGLVSGIRPGGIVQRRRGIHCECAETLGRFFSYGYRERVCRDLYGPCRDRKGVAGRISEGDLIISINVGFVVRNERSLQPFVNAYVLAAFAHDIAAEIGGEVDS